MVEAEVAHAVGHRQKALFDHAADQPCTATAQGCWVVGVIIAAGMNHQRASGEVAFLEPRRKDRLVCVALGVDVQRRQIAEVAVSPWGAMFARALWIVMAAGAQRSHFLAVLFGGIAARILVDVEAMHARGNTFEIRAEDQAIRRRAHLDLTDLGADSVLIDLEHRDAEVGHGLSGGKQQGDDEALRGTNS